MVAEVVSRKTRRIDEGEKKDACLNLPSLRVYLLIEQEMSAVVAHRRTEHGFVREVYTGARAVIALTEIGIELPNDAKDAGQGERPTVQEVGLPKEE